MSLCLAVLWIVRVGHLQDRLDADGAKSISGDGYLFLCKNLSDIVIKLGYDEWIGNALRVKVQQLVYWFVAS